MDEHERRRMEEQAELLADARRLRAAVKEFPDGELLSLYVILEKLGTAPESTALEQDRYRTAVRIYRAELLERLGRSHG